MMPQILSEIQEKLRWFATNVGRERRTGCIPTKIVGPEAALDCV